MDRMETHGHFARQTANALTVARIAAVPFFVAFLFGRSAGSGVAALSVFVFASVSDFFDGWAARRFGSQSRLGEFLDPLADKILTGSAFISFAFLPELGVPAWLVLAILLREAVLTLARAAAMAKGAPLRTEFAGKAKTAVQMTSIAAILVLLLFEKTPSLSKPAAYALLRLRLPFCLVAASAAAAVLSMASYYVKNLPSVGVWFGVGRRPGNSDRLDRFSKPDRPHDRRTAGSLLRGAALFFSTGCFIGFAPRAGGTIAAIVGSAIWVFCPPGLVYYSLCGFVLVFGFFAADYAEKRIFGGKDSPKIVIDEVAGVLVVFLSFTFTPTARGFLTCAVGFLLFRFFDILKPSPIRQIQRLEGGAGVLFDDLAAGVLANAGLQIFRLLADRGGALGP
jgi:CDP-diacylglycerol--glycerol-3-phosphate 3-phosphatidyltransferase